MPDTRAVTLHLLGFSINVEKSSFMPSQTTVYLGIRLDSVEMVACLSDPRMVDILSLARSVYTCTRFSAGSVQKLLGLMAAACAVGLLHA